MRHKLVYVTRHTLTAKKLVSHLLTGVAICSHLALFAQFPQLDSPFPFHPTETLLYDVSFNIVQVGSATLKITQINTLPTDYSNHAEPVYHIIYRVDSSPVLDLVYKIRDRVETWIDARGLFTRKIVKNIREGNYRRTFSGEVDYQTSVITTDKGTIPFQGVMRDPYSLFYYLRTIPLTPGDSLDFTTFDEDSFFTDFTVAVQKYEKVTVPAGEFDCLVVSPYHPKKFLVKNRGKLTIWFSKDSRRYPVKIMTEVSFGSMILKLRKISSTTQTDE